MTCAKPIEDSLEVLIDTIWINQTDKAPTSDQDRLARHVAHEWLNTMIGDDQTAGICIETLGSFFERGLTARYQDLAQTLQSIKNDRSIISNVENLIYIN